MKKRRQNVVLHGTHIAPGLAVGRAFIYKDILRRDYEFYDIEKHQVTEEHKRIKQAIEYVHKDLELSASRVEKELNAELAEIFRAQEAILQDPTLTQEILHELEQELTNAEHIIRHVFRRWERKFHTMEDVVLSQRADDVADLGRRLLFSLQGIHAHILENMPEGSVLVACRLLPSDTVFLSRQSTVAVVVEFGGPASHAALLTRALGIPAVGQISDVLQRIEPEEMLLVDGSEGTVICSPDSETLAAFEKQVEQYQVYVVHTKNLCHAPAITIDGANVEVMANVTGREDVEQALEYGADGIGLYRIESFYLSQKMLPTEQEVLDEMVQTLTPAKGRPITVRLLDVGGDKRLPFLNLPLEDDPFLGRRGIRLLLEYPDLLSTQIKAMAQLSQEFDIRMLVPMVTLAHEMEQVRSTLDTIVTDAGIGHMPSLGAMIETPAAALCVDDLLKYTDFFSIGTNDLTQYTMAAGRENPLVSEYFIEKHPAIFKLLKIIFDQAKNTPISLCGELAGNKEVISRILEIGVRSLSVPAPLVPAIKETVRNIDLRKEEEFC